LKEIIYVIIPTYNEATVIKCTVQEVLFHGFNVVVVDDGSNDNTADVLKEANVHYIRHCINLGQGAALQTGIKYALLKGAAYIVTFDADGQHCATDIKQVVDFIDQHQLDIVFGSRFLKTSQTNVSFSKKLLLQAARIINYLATGILLSDAHNGFRVFSRNGAAALQLFENRMSHATEILWQVQRNRLKYAEYPVTILYTKYSRRKGQKLMHSFKVFQDILLHKIFR